MVISSILARFGVPGYTGYCASKAALLGLVRSLALELAPKNVQVNAVCPGWVDTADVIRSRTPAAVLPQLSTVHPPCLNGRGFAALASPSATPVQARGMYGTQLWQNSGRCATPYQLPIVIKNSPLTFVRFIF